jgi:hypothetical protein
VRRMTNYAVVTAPNVEGLVRQTNGFMTVGWEPTGGAVHNPAGGYWTQAIVLFEEYSVAEGEAVVKLNRQEMEYLEGVLGQAAEEVAQGPTSASTVGEWRQVLQRKISVALTGLRLRQQ